MISPWLANLYLHWFDKVFHRPDGPARWAKAKLVRYADDLVILARYLSPKLIGFIESKLETWMGLEVNREKTRGISLKEEGASLDFLGFTFRYDSSRYAGGRRYLNVFPSEQSLKREREKLKELTGGRRRHWPIPGLIRQLNQHRKGWANYFDFGYPSQAFEKINHYVHLRLRNHLKRRSQRPFRRPEGSSDREHCQRLGLERL